MLEVPIIAVIGILGVFIMLGVAGGFVILQHWKDLRESDTALRETINRVCEQRDKYAISYQADQDALRFYADPLNWKSVSDKKHSAAAKDRGATARKALGVAPIE
jgi:hypothetical protein